MWYAVVAAVVVGLLVAYGAMFGFDKLKEALTQITSGNISNDKATTTGSDTNAQ